MIKSKNTFKIKILSKYKEISSKKHFLGVAQLIRTSVIFKIFVFDSNTIKICKTKHKIGITKEMSKKYFEINTFIYTCITGSKIDKN